MRQSRPVFSPACVMRWSRDVKDLSILLDLHRKRSELGEHKTMRIDLLIVLGQPTQEFSDPPAINLRASTIVS